MSITGPAETDPVEVGVNANKEPPLTCFADESIPGESLQGCIIRNQLFAMDHFEKAEHGRSNSLNVLGMENICKKAQFNNRAKEDPS